MNRVVTAVAADCDGVLTDGRQNIDPSGKKLFKSFHSRDIAAIRWLATMGIPVYVLSADDWPGSRKWVEKAGGIFFHTRDKVMTLLANRIDAHGLVAVGDDGWDVGMLEYADYPYCPADASRAVRYLDGMTVLEACGGAGVLSDLVLDLAGKEML